MANGLSVDQDTFTVKANVPDNLVGLSAAGEAEKDGEWAAWRGVTCFEVDGRIAVVLVSITVTALHPAKPGRGKQAKPGQDAGDALAARLHARYPGDTACIERFTTPGGEAAVSLHRVVTQRVSDRDVTTGQAQALVAYPQAGALGVVSAVAMNPADLDQAAALAVSVATGMTVTSAAAAA